MGCDIHIHIEYKKNIYIGTDTTGKSLYEEKWICGDYVRVNPYYGVFDEENKYILVGFCDNRDYSRFATLANVRNYGNTPYIDDPRGFPDDVTDEVKADAENWGCDGHSRSYLTLQELIDFQRDIPPLKHRGMINPEAAKALDENGELPEEWCQWTNQKDWQLREWTAENTVLVPLIEALKRRADELYVIGDFLWQRNPKEAYEKSKNIRIVFWFDN